MLREVGAFCLFITAHIPKITRVLSFDKKRHRIRQSLLKGTHARDFIVRFSHFFCHHSIKDKAEAQNFQIFIKLSVQSSYIIGFSRIPRYRRKRTVSLCVFGENATFHCAYSPKRHNSASSLNTLYTAKSAQFYSAFLQTTISLTPRFR